MDIHKHRTNELFYMCLKGKVIVPSREVSVYGHFHARASDCSFLFHHLHELDLTHSKSVIPGSSLKSGSATNHKGRADGQKDMG